MIISSAAVAGPLKSRESMALSFAGIYAAEKNVSTLMRENGRECVRIQWDFHVPAVVGGAREPKGLLVVTLLKAKGRPLKPYTA